MPLYPNLKTSRFTVYFHFGRERGGRGQAALSTFLGSPFDPVVFPPLFLQPRSPFSLLTYSFLYLPYWRKIKLSVSLGHNLSTFPSLQHFFLELYCSCFHSGTDRASWCLPRSLWDRHCTAISGAFSSKPIDLCLSFSYFSRLFIFF